MLKKELTNSASCKSVDELSKFNPEMELALTLTRFLMHLYLKKLILEVPNTMLDRAAMFYNYNRYLQVRCDIKGNQFVPMIG